MNSSVLAESVEIVHWTKYFKLEQRGIKLMVNLKQLRSLNDVFSNVMKQIFLTPASSDENQNDVTWAQRKILLLIESCGPQKMSDIAKQISVTMSGATAVVDKMVKTRLVTREFDPTDRRVVLIAMSEVGRATMLESVRVQERCFEAVLDRLAPEKRTELLKHFERIHQLLEEIQTCEGDIGATGMDHQAGAAMSNRGV